MEHLNTPTIEQDNSLQKISVVTSEVVQEKLEQILDFYNAQFPKSPHTLAGKMRKYTDVTASPINLIMESEGKIIALLESYRASGSTEDTPRLLETIVTDPSIRGQGFGKMIFERLLTEMQPNESLVLHFRDSNKESLEKTYAHLGFGGLRAVGNYKNGETKWEMTRPA